MQRRHSHPQAPLQVSLAEQREVLTKRNGSTLSRRSILKSYTGPQQPRGKRSPLAFDGAADVRQASSLPLLSVGTCSVQVRACAGMCSGLGQVPACAAS